MSLRSLVRQPAQIAAAAAIPFLARGGSGPGGEMRHLIAEKRYDRVATPKVDPWRFPSGSMPGFSPAQIVRVLRELRGRDEAIAEAFELLADDRSREIMSALIAYRALGPERFELPYDLDRRLKYYEQAEKLKVADTGEVFPPATMHIFEVDGVTVECWLGNVVAGFFERQYFFDRGGVSIQAERGDTVIDAGGCFGDTALVFAKAVGPEGRVHVFEPMPRQSEVLKRNLARNPELARVIEVAIDDLVRDRVLEPDFIKMDIEGAEPLAIDGARETIRRFRPKLGISIYHSFDDMFGIIRQLHAIEPSYEFYVDHHTVHTEETVLYARSAQ
jgi:hypothetical protein